MGSLMPLQRNISPHKVRTCLLWQCLIFSCVFFYLNTPDILTTSSLVGRNVLSLFEFEAVKDVSYCNYWLASISFRIKFNC